MARSQENNAILSTSPENSRHFSLKGRSDNRGLPKKGGAGSHNWGNLKDEMEADIRQESGKTEKKLRILNSDEFQKLHV